MISKILTTAKRAHKNPTFRDLSFSGGYCKTFVYTAPKLCTIGCNARKTKINLVTVEFSVGFECVKDNQSMPSNN